MMSIAIQYVVIYYLFSTASYVLKVKLCQSSFFPVRLIFLTSSALKLPQKMT